MAPDRTRFCMRRRAAGWDEGVRQMAEVATDECDVGGLDGHVSAHGPMTMPYGGGGQGGVVVDAVARHRRGRGSLEALDHQSAACARCPLRGRQHPRNGPAQAHGPASDAAHQPIPGTAPRPRLVREARRRLERLGQGVLAARFAGRGEG